MAYLKPVVAEVSANLYTAAKSANLQPAEVNQIEQMSYAIKKNRELSKMDSGVARQQFESLDSKAQDQLKFLFKDADYLKAPESITRKFFGTIGNAAHIGVSPLIGLFKLGGQYNRAINWGYKVAREVAQGEDLFSGKTWTDAWNGTNMYDEGAIKDVTNYYGTHDVTVARGLLSGKTPGEILESYGKVDTDIMNSIQRAYDEKSNFKEVLASVKYAQISPGRDIARMMDTKPPANGGLTGDYMAGRHQSLTGKIDFIYQIAIDPLTWLTGGLSKGVTKGERITKTVMEMIDNNVPAEKAIETIFKQEPKLFEFWDKGLGPAIKKYSESTDAAKADAFNDIARRFPGYNNREVIERLATKDQHLPNGVIDAASAQKYFENAGNLHLMLAGRVDGLTYMRNGVAVARSRRINTDGMSRYLEGVFNRTTKSTFAGAGRTTAEVDKAMDPVFKTLLNTEDAIQRAKNPASDLRVLVESNKEISRWKKIGKLAARSPGGLEVVVGENAVTTAANLTARARQILPKDMAEALTVKFLESTADEQFVILRNLDAATMYSMGLGGEQRGLDLMEKILREKYGNSGSFSSKVDSPIVPGHEPFLPDGSIKEIDGVKIISGQGPINPNQSTKAVASLPYDVIGSMVWDIKGKTSIIGAVGGATQGAHAKKIVNVWSVLTLFPRLGIRSAIDEGVMYLLTAPGKDLRAYALFARGKRAGDMSRTLTGSRQASGPIRGIIRETLQFGGRRSKTLDQLGRSKAVSPEDALSIERRVELIDDLAKKLNTDVWLLDNLEKREALVEEVFKMYGRYLSEKDLGHLYQAFIHEPDALSSTTNAIVARSGLSGDISSEIMTQLITPSNLTLAMESEKVVFNKVLNQIDMASLSDRQQALVHFEKFVKQLVGNKFKVDGTTHLNPAEIFFRYDGLRAGSTNAQGQHMIELALDDGMKKVGFEFDKVSQSWRIVDDTVAKEFLTTQSANTVALRAQGKTEAEIARIQLARLYQDMYVTFHGSATQYNDELMRLVQKNYNELVLMGANTGRIPSWNQAVARISLDDFADASINHRIAGEVNSQLGVGIYADVEGMFQRFGNTMFEQMDHQVNGIFRQPAVMVTYLGLRKKYKKLEENLARQVYHEIGGAWITTGIDKSLMARAERIAEKRFTEISTREAADTILKYADNPAIRSNFAYSMRTMGRYYRATEDFYRRIYRMKDVTPRVLYRMRLSHLGLGASGSIHTDAQNEMYVVMPMDNVVFRATEGVMRTLTGSTGYSQPQFNEFTLKLRMMNPSFSQDSGLPTLSGPIAALSVMGFKNILGTVPGKLPFIGSTLSSPTKKLAEGLDTLALGNIGDNIDVTRAIVPSSLQKIWAVLPFAEQSRQEATAAQQAIAYNAAHGIQLDPNADEATKAAYLKNIRISAHNIIVLRNMLGLIAPVAPMPMDSMGVPDYIKDTGIANIRSEFFDILNSVQKTYGADVHDPYELALSTFIGKYPGRLIYTVAPTSKKGSVVVKSVDALKNWAIDNQNAINTYGEVAYVFAPQTGKFNSATYNWVKAAGLVESKSLEQYYDDLLVSQDKQTYYDIAKKEKEELANTSDIELRANIINDATNARDALKAANPLLAPALIGEGNNIGTEEVMMGNMEQMLQDSNVNIDAGTRQSMGYAIKLVRSYVSFCKDPDLENVVNKVELKSARRAEVEAALKELISGNPYLYEANRSMFKAILSFYSRDSYYITKELR